MQYWGQRTVRISTLTNLQDISAKTRAHLRSTYLTLCVLLAIASLGSVLHIVADIGKSFFPFLHVSFVLLLWFYFTPNTSENYTKRFGLLSAFVFLQGVGIGPLLRLVLTQLENGPKLVFLSLSGTAVVFASFSAASLLSQRRSLLFLGGIIGSLMNVMFWLMLFSLFWGGLFSIRLYIGLALFSLFVVYDTQLIVERAELGDNDVLKHALELFIDFIAIFVRLLILLSKKEQKKSQKK